MNEEVLPDVASGTAGGVTTPQVTASQTPVPAEVTVSTPVADGWYRFFKTRKAHYFKNNVSLCKEYTGSQKNMVRIELSEIHKHPKCMACLRVAATMTDQLEIVPSIIHLKQDEEIKTTEGKGVSDTVVVKKGKNVSDSVVLIRAPPAPKVPLKTKLRDFLMKVLS